MTGRLSMVILVLVTLAAPAATAAEHLRLAERATNENVVSVSLAPDGIGDLLVFSNSLRNAANRAAVGTSRGDGVRVEIGQWGQRHWTMQLAAGACGSLRVHARDATHSEYDVTIERQ